ncbi:MAG: sigma-54-dependent Fis family transcriptional regulator [Alphaproteobacteria bacterium]|nr:sigma-54-dependent Fis family transcriptional regulator [Alphaproteobacteria bacterium]
MTSPTDLHQLSTLDVRTEDEAGAQGHAAPWRFTLTVLAHPDLGRVGARARLDPAGELQISRVTPLFSGPGGAQPRALDTPRLSRAPLSMQVAGERLRVHVAEQQPARIDGRPVEGAQTLSLDRVRRAGVLIELGRCVLLWLHLAPVDEADEDDLGLVGVSLAMARVRAQVRVASRAPGPVLIRGETGSGKELVARALHRLGPRAGGPLISVNMAAIPRELAAATLFGHARGAFTGAVSDQPGLFGQAHGGTLFLDEVGETPDAVQPQLLRALDQGEIQPAGRPPAVVDVRVIAATDADLEQLVQEGHFREALYYRLRGVQLRVPPLRARQVDVPLLLARFLTEALERLGASHRLDPPTPGARPWLGLKLVLGLMARPFNGNVRELRSLANEIALFSADQPSAALPPEAEGAAPPPEAPPAEPEAPGALSPDLVRQVMRTHRWRVGPSAKALGVSRNTLVAAIEQTPGLRLARDLDADTIRAALQEHGDESAAAAALEVSAHGLKLRAHALGLRE